MHKISIIVPVFNDRSALKEFIVSLKRIIAELDIPHEYIVVDDGSTDGTSDELKKNNIPFLRHDINLGYGAALKTGINRAQGDIICIIDGDNTYSPGDIKRLIQYVDEFDMVVGARIKDAKRNFIFYQRWAKYLVCLLLRLLFRKEVPDINSGLRLFKKDIAEKYYSLLPDGFSFTASITLIMLLAGYKIKYVPIGYFKRTGKAKVKVIGYTFNFIRSYLKILSGFKFNG